MKAVVLTFVALAGLVGCTVGGSGDTTNADVGDQEPLVPADDSSGVGSDNVNLMPGDQARVCDATALNLRSGPSTNDEILKVMPNGSTSTVVSVQGSWVQLDWTGAVGWSSARYLCAVTPDTTAPPTGEGLSSTEISRESFLSIAAASVGFSYYWGGGRLAEGAPPGACYGSCPNCRHEGSYGADCSGYIGKTWLLPASLPMDANKHPYSTASFAGSNALWSGVNRTNILPGDALVYRSSGSGHIVLYEKDDPWGSFWAYEARGCSYGIVHNIRTAGSAYKAIRRAGL